jgi:hypothetical protein
MIDKKKKQMKNLMRDPSGFGILGIIAIILLIFIQGKGCNDNNLKYNTMEPSPTNLRKTVT